MPSSCNRNEIVATVDLLLKDAGVLSTKTKSGWCLKEGLVHLLSAADGKMFPLVKQHGVPSMYDSLQSCRHSEAMLQPTSQAGPLPKNCFQSLCRIVAGQQLAG